MLFEKTIYENDFPINMRIMQVVEYPIHYHHDIEFVYVLKGEVRLKDVCSNYLLKEGDLFTINGHEVHGLTATDKDNVVAVIQISNRFCTQYFPSLGKACFMTGGKNDTHNKLDQLRKILLRILLNYSCKSFNYKNDSTYQMIDAVRYLNEHFNLFAFEGQDVLNFKSNNPVIVERISRIINYVYENHANKISLEELSVREHLSTYYLSHLIHDYMGISFKEFLSFARVEMSEIPLLETDAKISSIAAGCGFSTTLYYEKFFLKWFGHTPQQHRQKFMSHILSNEYPARIKILPENDAVRLLKQCLSAESDQESSSSVINHLHLQVTIASDAAPLMPFHHPLEVSITQEDYQVMGERLFSFLHELNISKVILAAKDGDSESSLMLLANRLNFSGYNVSNACESALDVPVSYGHDSICAAVQLLQMLSAINDQPLHVRLRDQGESLKILKGFPACLTSCMIPKPIFYAYQLVSSIRGELISWGKYYYVTRTKSRATSDNPAYTIVVFNFNDEISSLCTRPTSVHETNDVIRSFMDELNIDFSIPAVPGKYVIAKYALSNDNSIFEQMSHINFPDKFPLQDEWIHLLNTQPLSQISIENMEDKLSVSASIRGAGIHVIVAKGIDSKS